MPGPWTQTHARTAIPACDKAFAAVRLPFFLRLREPSRLHPCARGFPRVFILGRGARIARAFFRAKGFPARYPQRCRSHGRAWGHQEITPALVVLHSLLRKNDRAVILRKSDGDLPPRARSP